ncbi:MAG: hypothetical protein FJ011_05215 [Chloroflexi bacterium]|nr:hypothetical protein [Chloroflexota bacterium]
MTIYSTGEMSGRTSEKDLRRLQIPLPDDHHRLADSFRERRARLAELKRQAADQQDQIAQLRTQIIEGAADSTE